MRLNRGRQPEARVQIGRPQVNHTTSALRERTKNPTSGGPDTINGKPDQVATKTVATGAIVQGNTTVPFESIPTCELKSMVPFSMSKLVSISFCHLRELDLTNHS
jgi:hypothetical protein